MVNNPSFVKLNELVETHEKLRTLGVLRYDLKKVQDYADALFSRFCPIKLDAVVKTKNVQITKFNNLCYLPFREEILNGYGVVVGQDYGDGKFLFTVKFKSGDKEVFIVLTEDEIEEV